MKRSTRMVLAREAVEITERGWYELPDGQVCNIATDVQSCLESTRFFPPQELEQFRLDVLSRLAGNTTAIEVHNESTLAGISRLHAEGAAHVAALNFASAKNPGGGFLNGSHAQEESLARSSALHASLMRAFEFYERHRALSTCLYTDAMILSPGCPVFRDDEGALLSQPHLTTFLTSAAPNAGAIADNAPEELPLIPKTFHRRAECVLALAAWHGCESLVLGAWGCGVFRNDPDVVARAFASHICDGAWAGRFRRIVFSVLDNSSEQRTLRAFQRMFPDSSGERGA